MAEAPAYDPASREVLGTLQHRPARQVDLQTPRRGGMGNGIIAP